MARKAGYRLGVAVLMGVLAAPPAEAGDQHERGRDGNGGDHERGREREASPFVVGTWKFVPNGNQPPKVDTEFRFINPTALSLTLEYAFFNLDGSFCGCDRDDFPPNKTTIYTMLQEQQLGAGPAGPLVFSCSDTSGAMKAIVFLNKGEEIFLGDASQVGFQTHAFGGIDETDPALLLGNVMTEAGLQRVPINDSTREEIRKIHEQCNTVNGPLSTGG
jgi:hypothetical protein